MKKGDFVKVQGLQSDAGMKLNGSHALILANAMTFAENKATGSTTRYPVLLFALRCEEKDGVLNPILVDAPKKKVKVEHLAPVMAETTEAQEALDLFRPAALSHIQSAYELGEFNNHNKHIHFLIEQCREKFPDDLETNIFYAKLLVGIQGKFEHGAKVLQPFLPQVLDENFEAELALPSCYEDVSELYKDFSFTFARAGKAFFQDAMDCAMKICCAVAATSGSSSAIRVQNATEALQALQGECSQILQNNQLEQYPYIAGLLVKSCEMVIKVQPDGDKKPDLVGMLGSANAIAENYIKASKLLRKALAMDNLHLYPGFEEHKKELLILSQMQCPGMPLEDVIVLSSRGSQATCIKKSDAESCIMGPPLFPGGPLAMMSETGPPKIFYYSLPQDPNDPEIFPAWLLEQTKPGDVDEEEEEE